MVTTLQLRQPIAREISATTELPDSELVASFKSDPQVFALLYTRYADSIFRYCYRRLSSREAAEDATSQVFTQALTALPRFDNSTDAFRGWPFTIANHVLIDLSRSTKRQGWTELTEEAPDTGQSPEEIAVQLDGERTLRAAMEQLPPRERQVVELRLAGLTGSEIGAVLGCRRGAVAVAHFRAINHLRTLLGIEVQPEGDPRV